MELDFKDFTGVAFYQDQGPGEDEITAKIWVRYEIDQLDGFARLDTGSAYTMMDFEIAQACGLDQMDGDPVPPLLTAFGRVTDGKLVRHELKLIADCGEDLVVPILVFVTEAWRAGTFIGYSGCLEFLRFELDCRRNLFYFTRD